MATVVTMQYDGRKPGQAGPCIVEINYNDAADGSYEQKFCEGLANEDVVARFTAQLATLQAARKAREIARNIADITANGSLATPRLVLSTGAENFAALRLAYADATKMDAIMLGDFLSTLTNAQLQTAFGMTSQQVTTLRTNKLTPAASAAATIRASAGA